MVTHEKELLLSMDLEEKIGQTLIFGFHGYSLDYDYQQWLESGRLGNIKIFLRNVLSKDQIIDLTSAINYLVNSSKHGIPPFIATDLEGGTVYHVRYPGVSVAPAAGFLGATGNPENSRDAARLIALNLLSLGINMNLAPCVDVLTNPHNSVIGTRSYSSDPNTVFN
ncbi:MAG: glycoside hydrolase family 3 N-terminal domain-containing protein, partial [Spirochaetota bacterium]